MLRLTDTYAAGARAARQKLAVSSRTIIQALHKRDAAVLANATHKPAKSPETLATSFKKSPSAQRFGAAVAQAKQTGLDNWLYAVPKTRGAGGF